tara:strand:+ start:201 stop:458 length:258 start_codon:yes stop_codon:yes gene_type:complete
MSDKPTMSSDELKAKIDEYLNDGGEIIQLRYASEKDQKKAQRRWHHKDKATAGSEASQEILDKENAKEKSMIFSKDERWSVDPGK